LSTRPCVDIELGRKVTTAVTSIALISGMVALMTPLYWYVVPRASASYVVGSLLLITLATSVTAAYIRAQGPTLLASWLFLPPVCGSLWFIWSTGGILSTGTLWLAVVPMLAVCTFGIRAGALFACFTTGSLIVLFVLHRLEWVPESALTNADQELLRLLNLVSLSVGLCALTWGYERSRQRALAEISWAVERIERAAALKCHRLANLSHELRTPLSAILGALDLLDVAPSHADASPSHGSLCETVERNARQLSQQVQNLVDLSRVEAHDFKLRLQTFSLQKLLAAVVRSKQVEAERKGLELRFDRVGLTPGLMRADAWRVAQLTDILLDNAIKFTEHGTVALRLRMAEPGPKLEPHVEIEVTDTGIGIARQDLDVIFEPFTQADVTSTRRYGGSGLGLALGRCLVERLHGELVASSTPGHGSVFRARLPTRPPRPTGQSGAPNSHAHERRSRTRAASRPCKILLIERESERHGALAEILRRAHCSVERAHEHSEVSFSFAAAESAGAPFDLALISAELLEMPGGSQGVAQSIRSAGFAGPVLALTGADPGRAAALCAQRGVDSTIVEPPVEDDVLRQIYYHAGAAHVTQRARVGGRKDPLAAQAVSATTVPVLESPPEAKHSTVLGSKLLARWVTAAASWAPKPDDGEGRSEGHHPIDREGLTLALSSSVLAAGVFVAALFFGFSIVAPNLSQHGLPRTQLTLMSASLLALSIAIAAGGLLALRTGHVRAFGTGVLALSCASMVSLNVAAGDWSVHASAWSAFLPMVALSFCGALGTCLWGLTAIGTIGLVYLTVGDTSAGIPSRQSVLLLDLIAAICFIGAGFLLSLALEATKDVVFEQLERARDQAERATASSLSLLLGVTTEAHRPLLALRGLATALSTFAEREDAQRVVTAIRSHSGAVLRLTQSLVAGAVATGAPYAGDTPLLARSHGEDVPETRELPRNTSDLAPSSRRHRPGARILLAEDGRDNQRLFTLMLKSAGYAIEVAENGAIAVEMGRAALEQHEPFDLILMDLMMPEMDGIEATARLRTAGYEGPIVALTADALLGTRERCLGAGCSDYATKPIRRDALLALVAGTLAKLAPSGS